MRGSVLRAVTTSWSPPVHPWEMVRRLRDARQERTVTSTCPVMRELWADGHLYRAGRVERAKREARDNRATVSTRSFANNLSPGPPWSVLIGCHPAGPASSLAVPRIVPVMGCLDFQPNEDRSRIRSAGFQPFEGEVSPSQTPWDQQTFPRDCHPTFD